jgi:hypothetical protein
VLAPPQTTRSSECRVLRSLVAAGGWGLWVRSEARRDRPGAWPEPAFRLHPVSQVGRIIAGTASAAATAGLLPGGVVPAGAAREGGTVNCSSSRRRRARPPNLSSLPFNLAAPEELVDELGASLACLLQSLVVRLIRHILPAQ